MTALIKDGKLVEDPFVDVSGADEIPSEGAVLVSLEQWQDHWDLLGQRDDPIGVKLTSDQHPDIISDDGFARLQEFHDGFAARPAVASYLAARPD